MEDAMIGILCLGVALATAPAAPAPAAPAPAAIGSGTRVRLTFAPQADPLAPGRQGASTQRVGRVVAVGERTITMAFDGRSRPVEFDRASIIRVERSLGGRPRAKGVGRGLGIGLMVGVASGALIGVASGDDEGGFINFSAGDKAAICGIGLGVVGALGGAVVGAMGSGERWERGAPVFASGPVGVHVVPAGGRGAGMALSLRF
jgi:hypothetical protein